MDRLLSHRWKLSAQLQSVARTRFFGLPLLPSFVSPPYLTAEPVITTTKIDLENNDFLILASDGLWDHLSSEQAVELVGRWLSKNSPERMPWDRLTIGLASLIGEEDDYDKKFVKAPPDCRIKGRAYTDTKYSDEKNWVVVDQNAASHLIRNALGGSDEDLFAGLVGWSESNTLRRMR